jgi:signal transduction histidine kinase
MGWIAYVAAWIAAAVFWAIAGSAGQGVSPMVAVPLAMVTMTSAGIMGVGVWHLTARVAWNWRAPGFHAVHLGAMAVFSLVYAFSPVWFEIASGSVAQMIGLVWRSPVLVWNLLMGSWLYLIVAGLSYAIRAERQARANNDAAIQARLLAQQAQLAALRAQINPHFLFNALHTVGALVTSDPALADRALERLGDLLRYALHADEQVPLASEWAFTMDYLAFEQLRLADRLQVTTHLDEAARSVLVPPLILQPIVENAVRHGISDRPDGGRVDIAARVAGGTCVLSVQDDGCGGEDTASGGVGLSSVRRRLEALYGEAASLGVQRGEPGFTVVMRLPVRQDDED